MATKKKQDSEGVTFGKMQGLVVPKGSFPHRRVTHCCQKQAKAGEVVVVFPIRQGGTLTKHVIVHKRCLVELVTRLPADAEDYTSRWTIIRESVLERGDPFPDRRKTKR